MMSLNDTTIKLLIIGFGSIGRRHYEIVKDFENVENITVVTKQNLPLISTYNILSEVKNLDYYNYFIISSETIKHYDQLKYLCSKVDNKKILVEKPLFDKLRGNMKYKSNQVFTAYNLRFHPVILKLKELLENEEVYFANIICGHYLPLWRPNQDYRNSYSADISKGGGVLRDLSHELDYVNWIFGDIEKLDNILVE